MPCYRMIVCRLTMSEPRGSLSVPHDCKFVCSQQFGTAFKTGQCPKSSYGLTITITLQWLPQSRRIFGSLVFAVSGEPTSPPVRHCRLTATAYAPSDPLRFVWRMQNCEHPARVGSELHDARGWTCRSREQIQVHTQRLFPRFPHFSVSGGGSSGSFDGGVISLSPPHLSPGRPLDCSRTSRPQVYTTDPPDIWEHCRSTGRHDHLRLKKTSKVELRRCAAPCSAVLTPAITISPDPFVSEPV